MITAETFPRDINEERRVLGGILLSPDSIDDIAYLHPEDFFFRESQLIYKAMLELREHDQYIDLGTISHHTSLSEDEVREGILECPRDAIEAHAEIVQKLAIQRSFMEIGAEIYSEAYGWNDRPELLQAWAEQRVVAAARNSNQVVTAGSIAAEIMATIEQPREIGISRGFSNVDNILGEMEAGNVEIVAGRAHAGKSRYAMSVALNIARNGKRVLYVPLEETGEAVTYRLLHMLTTDMNGHAVPIEMIKRRQWSSDEDLYRVKLAAEELQGLPISLTDQMVFTAPEIASSCRVAARDGLDLVVLDYVQLVEGNSKGDENNRNKELSKVSRTLKLTARATNSRMMVLSQMSREITRRQNETDYRLSDLRDCGSLEQDADVVAFVHKPLRCDEAIGPYNVKVIVKKNRPTGTLGTTLLKAMKVDFNGEPGSYALRE